MTGRAPAVSLALAALLLVGACASGTATPSPAASSPDATSSAAPVATATPATPAAPTPVPTPLPSGLAVALDNSLLAILPASIAGTQVTSEASSFADAMKDPSFIANVDRAAFAVAVNGNDLASGVIAHLRAGVFSDAFWQDWRDTYDEGACAQAGGVLAHATMTLGSRDIFVTTCAGGLRVYHAWLPGPGVIVSLFSVGNGRFGDLLMEGLRG